MIIFQGGKILYITPTSEIKKKDHPSPTGDNNQQNGKDYDHTPSNNKSKGKPSKKKREVIKEDNKMRLRYRVPNYRKDKFLETRTSNNMMTAQTISHNNHHCSKQSNNRGKKCTTTTQNH
ncbi:hypothetical protein RDI58_026802 [Solanum bulbocastanum]|uniref:Uncharacterized protein n=1 Tax=Solanum bulbocastanum TaxID=147425 RepID=A0AAN8SZP2_SOLBU